MGLTIKSPMKMTTKSLKERSLNGRGSPLKLQTRNIRAQSIMQTITFLFTIS